MDARIERTEKTKASRKQEQIAAHLLHTYGPVISSDKLWQILSFKSRQAFDRSVQRNRTALPLFRPEGRDGVFVLAPDLAEHLVTLSQASLIYRNDHLSADANSAET
jgi:hypothetical protein